MIIGDEQTFHHGVIIAIVEDFGSVDGYERHIVTRHPNLPDYPGPADIKFYGLEKQDMSWEREIKADFEWK